MITLDRGAPCRRRGYEAWRSPMDVASVRWWVTLPVPLPTS